MKPAEIKRITVLITKKNNEKIQKFRIEFMKETQENMSFAEALNWLLNFGASSWFRKGREEFRRKFYNVWAKSAPHRQYERDIDEFDFLKFIQKKRNQVNSDI